MYVRRLRKHSEAKTPEKKNLEVRCYAIDISIALDHVLFCLTQAKMEGLSADQVKLQAMIAAAAAKRRNLYFH